MSNVHQSRRFDLSGTLSPSLSLTKLPTSPHTRSHTAKCVSEEPNGVGTQIRRMQDGNRVMTTYAQAFVPESFTFLNITVSTLNPIAYGSVSPAEHCALHSPFCSCKFLFPPLSDSTSPCATPLANTSLSPSSLSSPLPLPLRLLSAPPPVLGIVDTTSPH